ncbi:MAG: hypothetical protein DHS20C06_00570 [Hyphobacterium sp.]|nr:MAG: hypothetical protein DHS20C06_00570 [Hyphobacterium sp.]
MKRVVFLVLISSLALVLSACAFQPLYGTSQQVGALRSISIDVDGQERIDQMLSEALNDRFGSPTGGRYRLVAEADYSTGRLGVGSNDIASRAVLTLSIDFSLVEVATDNPLLTERVRTEATFDIPAQPYAAISARRDAEERAAREAADRIALRVARHMNRAGQ